MNIARTLGAGRQSIGKLNPFPQFRLWLRLHWREALLMAFLSLLAAFGSYLASSQIDPVILSRDTDSVWFESDVFRVYQDMTTRGGDHYRTSVHPLFPLLAYPPTFVLRRVQHLDAPTAVRVVVAVVAGLWMAALYGLLRLIGLRWLDAVLFTLVGATSAAAMAWLIVPETYPLGSISLLLALAVVAAAERVKVPWLAFWLASALTLSFTITNWMAGLIATIVSQSWRRTLQITLGAFSVVVIAWGVEKYIFPTAQFFIGSSEEVSYTLSADSGGPLQIASSFFFHSMVMPAINIVAKVKHPNWSIVSVQASTLGSSSAVGVVAVILWTALLGLGVWSLITLKDHPRLRLALALTLLGQFTLHLVYGDETFLYALHFAPLLVVLAALTSRTRLRTVAQLLASALVITGGANNVLQLQRAVAYVHTLHSARSDVREQMALRPNDPWPRGVGHVILAIPGSLEVDKAYEEPGGSFSPSVGSFGVSLWVANPAGQLIDTSDHIPLDNIQQRFLWAGGQVIPSLATTTAYYQSLWSLAGSGRWTLHLTQPANPGVRLEIAVRSVGPAGGPITSLKWSGQRLFINNRWILTVQPAPVAVDIGQEGPPGWTGTYTGLTDWQGAGGWGYARFELDQSHAWDLTIDDTNAQPANTFVMADTAAKVTLNLPDARFADSLRAQVANMTMSLVGNETRPGDPMNYPLAWQRDGAYEIAALAQAGQLTLAKELSTYLAQNDFYGGFGPEADAPGLAIWSLEQVAERLNDPAYDAWLWPHVRRKAEFILRMASARQLIYQPVTGPLTPGMLLDPKLGLVAQAARGGLIQGQMDHEQPVLYVNAVSYRGLLDAASLAERLGQGEAAQQWRTEAAKLQQAWGADLRSPATDDDRTFIVGLWPTNVAANSAGVYRQNLDTRWASRRTDQGDFRVAPVWTYFDVAEAHQWLYLNQPGRAWLTLEWFWDHQDSPGLYTWGEGKGEVNSFRLWPNVRGWLDPPDVTPHYWTAAEVLMLQMDMLAYMDTIGQPALVIGGGIPVDWLSQPMSVAGLSLPQHQVDWSWDGQQVHVTIHGPQVPVRLGAAFPPGTPTQVEIVAVN
jgi:hypothetical protein